MLCYNGILKFIISGKKVTLLLCILLIFGSSYLNALVKSPHDKIKVLKVSKCNIFLQQFLKD